MFISVQNIYEKISSADKLVELKSGSIPFPMNEIINFLSKDFSSRYQYEWQSESGFEMTIK